MKLFGRKRPQRSADTSEKSPETVNVQSRDVSVAESDTEMMTENVYLGQEQYQPKELQVSAAGEISRIVCVIPACRIKGFWRLSVTAWEALEAVNWPVIQLVQGWLMRFKNAVMHSRQIFLCVQLRK
mgnify:CR=1 FL=1